MSMLREQLVLKALAALSEIADECGKAPARKTLGLRFILAYTYVASGADPKLKWIWTDFWRHATAPRRSARHQQAMDDYIRGTGARSALNGICREIGYAADPDFLGMLRGQRPAKDGHGPSEASPLPKPSNDGPDDDDAA